MVRRPAAPTPELPAAAAAEDGEALGTPRTVRIPLSALGKKLSGVTHTEKLQENSLTPITNFFVRANWAVIIGVFLFALLEHFTSAANAPRVIDNKVIIASIAGVTIQAAAIIIAAFKGLFK